MLYLIAIGIFVVVVASTWWFGLWNNFLTLINVLIAGLVASSFYQNVARELINSQPEYRYLMDFISVWLLFVVTLLILRVLTGVLSTMRLKFDTVTEMVGRSILSIWIALVFICFTCFTLHMAPIEPDFYGDTRISTTEKMLGIGPDHFWLAFIQSRSRGALSESQDSTMWPKYSGFLHPDDADLNLRVFDSQAKFIDFYAYHRRQLSRQSTLRSATQ